MYSKSQITITGKFIGVTFMGTWGTRLFRVWGTVHYAVPHTFCDKKFILLHIIICLLHISYLYIYIIYTIYIYIYIYIIYNISYISCVIYIICLLHIVTV